MADAQALVDIITAFFNALKTVINALKALFGMDDNGSKVEGE